MLQREEEQLLAEEAPVGLVALATVRGELCKALTDSQLQLLGDWLGESPGGVPLVEMYMKQELSATASPPLPPLPPIDGAAAAAAAAAASSAAPASTSVAAAGMGGAVSSSHGVGAAASSTGRASCVDVDARLGATAAGAADSATCGDCNIVGAGRSHCVDGGGVRAPDGAAIAALSIAGQGVDSQLCGVREAAGGTASSGGGTDVVRCGLGGGGGGGAVGSGGAGGAAGPALGAAATLANATPESLGCASWAAAAAMAAAAAAAAATAAANSSEAREASASANARGGLRGLADCEPEAAHVHVHVLRSSTLDEPSARVSFVDASGSTAHGTVAGAGGGSTGDGSGRRGDGHGSGQSGSDSCYATSGGGGSSTAMGSCDGGDAVLLRRRVSPSLSAGSHDGASSAGPEAEDFLKQAINEAVFSNLGSMGMEEMDGGLVVAPVTEAAATRAPQTMAAPGLAEAVAASRVEGEVGATDAPRKRKRTR